MAHSFKRRPRADSFMRWLGSDEPQGKSDIAKCSLDPNWRDHLKEICRIAGAKITDEPELWVIFAPSIYPRENLVCKGNGIEAWRIAFLLAAVID